LFPSSLLCPRCQCGACYPLHRKGVDWALSLLGFRPARCLTCMRKFYTRYSLERTEAQRQSGDGSAVVSVSPETTSPDRRRAA